MGFITDYSFYWTWYGIAALLLGLETIFGGFRWLGVSIGALAVGVLAMLFPWITAPLQLLLFIILGGIFMWMAHAHTHEQQAKAEKLKKIVTDKTYIGQTFILQAPIVNGKGSLKIDNMRWAISGDDNPIGTPVRVVDMNDGQLFVEPINP